jgi:hypothetical protein
MRFFLISALVLVSGCFNPFSPSGGLGNQESLNRVLPLPTKDQILLVDGRPVSISDYMRFRALMPEVKKDALVNDLVAITVIINDADKRGVSGFSADSALKLLKYASGEPLPADSPSVLDLYTAGRGAPGPSELKSQIATLVSRAVVQTNTRVLAQMN